jgi:hypothetical protein
MSNVSLTRRWQCFVHVYEPNRTRCAAGETGRTYNMKQQTHLSKANIGIVCFHNVFTDLYYALRYSGLCASVSNDEA